MELIKNKVMCKAVLTYLQFSYKVFIFLFVFFVVVELFILIPPTVMLMTEP